MAFKDITKVLYDGKIKLDYKDKAHRYYVRHRITWDLPEDDPKAWGPATRPKGTTTLLGDTLEKKGLMQWPKQVALKELFGFYNAFKVVNEETGELKEIPAGFSKGVGTLWGKQMDIANKEELIELLKSADTGWQRKQKKGADIGSCVHDAIEHYVRANPNNPEAPEFNESYDIAENYNWAIKEAEYASEAAEQQAWEDAPEEIAQAELAFSKFKQWWDETSPILYGAEDLLYSLAYDVCGTYDGDIGINKKFHPVFKEDDKMPEVIRVTADWKTSKASTSKEAAMPEGVNYQYFIQSAIYEMIRREMNFPPADDLLIVSARKDGGFTLIYASELGLTVQECIDWAVAVILCFRLAAKSKAGLIAHAKEEEK